MPDLADVLDMVDSLGLPEVPPPISTTLVAKESPDGLAAKVLLLDDPGERQHHVSRREVPHGSQSRPISVVPSFTVVDHL